MFERQPHAAQAEERVRLALLGEARDRLVAARIERADGDGLARCPFGDPPIGAAWRSSSGSAPVPNRSSVRTRPMPSQDAGIEAVELRPPRC